MSSHIIEAHLRIHIKKMEQKPESQKEQSPSNFLVESLGFSM